MASLGTTAVRRTPQRGLPLPTANPYETPVQAHAAAPPGSLAPNRAVNPPVSIQAGLVNNIDPATGRAISPAVPMQPAAKPSAPLDQTIQRTPPTDYSLVTGNPGIQPESGGLTSGAIQSLLDKMNVPTLPREPAPQDEPRVSGPSAAPYQGQTLAFSRAKDASSRIHGKALQALKDQMTSRGISGSGIEADATAEMLTDAANYQSGADLAQAIASDERGWEGTKLGYQGDLSQRGQDLGLNTSTTGFGVSQRGQDIGVNQGNQGVQLALAQLLARMQRY